MEARDEYKFQLCLNITLYADNRKLLKKVNSGIFGGSFEFPLKHFQANLE